MNGRQAAARRTPTEHLQLGFAENSAECCFCPQGLQRVASTGTRLQGITDTRWGTIRFGSGLGAAVLRHACLWMCTCARRALTGEYMFVCFGGLC